MDMDIFTLTFKAILLFGSITIVFSSIVQQIDIKDNKIPVKGGDIQIVCEVSQLTTEIVRVYKTDSLPQDITTATSLTECSSSQCAVTTPRHTFSPSSSGVTITVTNLNRAEDQKYWTCAIRNQRQYMQLTVYTITPSLQYDNQPNQDQDLVKNSMVLKCSTGCAFPSPNFTWYYSKTGESRQEWSTTSPVTDRTGGCTDSEKIYTSTLTLSRYTQFTDNTDTSVKFQCGVISITGAEDQLFTPASVNVRFAVRVSTVTLKDGNLVPSNSLEVNSGEPHTLTCTSSVSRPTATIIWYFGGQKNKTETSRTSSFTFTPENSDNQKQVYCKAFNIQSESQAVSSDIVSLYVKGKPKVCDCNNGAVNNDIKAVIVGIVLGIIIVVVVAYAGYVTILLKRKGENTAENTFVQPAIRTVPLNTSVVFSTNDSEEQQGTDPDESRESQYTSLKTELKDDRQTYEQLKV